MKSKNGFVKLIKRYQSALLVFVAIILCASSIFVANIYINAMKNSLWKQIVSDITEVTYQGSHTFGTYIEQERETLDVFASNLSTQKFKTEDEKKKTLDLLNLYANDKSFYSLIVYEGDTDVQIYIAGDYTPIKASQIDYEKYGESGITEPYLNNYTGQKTIGYYQRIVFADGTNAIIRKGQLVSHITDSFSLSFYNNTGFSYIVNRDGDIMIRPTHKNSNRTGSNIFGILEYKDKAEEEARILKDALEKNKVGAMLSTTGSYERLIAYVPIDGVENWYMISVIPNSSVSQNVEEIIRSTTAITIIVTSVIIIFALFLVTTYLFRKKAIAQEAEVKYREQLFGILANNTDEVFIMISCEDNSVEYISPNILRVLGIEPNLIKKDLYNIGKPVGSDTYGVLDKIADLKEGESVLFDSERNNVLTNVVQYFRESAYRVSIDGVDKVIIIYSDRTMEKKAEMALMSAMEISVTASNAKSSFLSSMSHDIRTPMNAILGFTELIRYDVKDQNKVLQHVSKIQASGQHLLGLINDILDVSKIESGKVVLNIQEFNMAEFINGIDAIIRPQANSKKQEFEIIADGIKEEHLLADKLRINQIFINILSNAIKYTPENGKIVMKITELPRKKEKYAHLRFVIEDNGIGMSEEYLKEIFNPFTREVNSTVNSIQGTGLGMTITKNLIDLFGGTINVESEIDKGTKFIVELELRVDRSEYNSEFWKEHNIKRALVIDDDMQNCHNIKGMLENASLATDFSLSGEDAVQKVKENEGTNNQFDLLLIDLVMPEMDGIETAREIRKVVDRNIIIILISANDWIDFEDKARQAGIDIFISKPIFVSNLKTNIHLLISERENEEKNDRVTFDNKTILIVEDNLLNSEIVISLLELHGAKCDLARNGKVAVEKFLASEKGHYDLILMDVQMPKMNGYEATKAIRASNHPDATTIPIIAMTANAFTEDVKEALNSGMDAHIAKPINIVQIEEAYKKVINNKK